MKIVDANIVLRYLLNDIEELLEKAAEILENNEVFVPNEVIAEKDIVIELVLSSLGKNKNRPQACFEKSSTLSVV